MKYLVVPKFQLILGWNPKCACTTAKTAMLLALGHEIRGNVHNDMLTQENLKSGKYDIYTIRAYRKLNEFRPKDFRRVCILRNPYSRFISAIRQRSHSLSKDPRFVQMTPSDYLEYLEKNDYGEDHHFHPQTNHLRPFGFDRVLDVSEMSEFFGMLQLPYQGERFGRHETSYGGSDRSMHSASLLDLTKIDRFPASIDSWLHPDGVSKLRALYASDFDFALRHGHEYGLPAV